MTNDCEYSAPVIPVEQRKSEARACLRFVAKETRYGAEGYCAAIMSGEEGFMDHICAFIGAVHALREEFAAWQESHTVHDRKCKSRRLLAEVSAMFDEPVLDPKLIEEEVCNNLDICRQLYLDNDRQASELICCLVEAVHTLRDDLIAWGRDDRLPWERAIENRA